VQYETIQHAAERLAVNPRTIRRMIARGDLPAYRFGPTIVRLIPAEVDDAVRPIPTANGAA
jgi:excisionase family DNA binding protein